MSRSDEAEGKLRDLFDVAQADRSGDAKRFHVVVDRMKRLYGEDVLAHARRRAPPDRAEEVAQETWADVPRALETFRGEATFHSWLLHITARKAVDVLRKVHGKRYEELSETCSKLLAPSRESPSREVARAEMDDLVQDFIAELEPEEQELVILHYHEGQPAADIARARGVPPNTVAQRLVRIRRRLKKLCEEAGISRP